MCSPVSACTLTLRQLLCVFHCVCMYTDIKTATLCVPLCIYANVKRATLCVPLCLHADVQTAALCFPLCPYIALTPALTVHLYVPQRLYTTIKTAMQLLCMLLWVFTLPLTPQSPSSPAFQDCPQTSSLMVSMGLVAYSRSSVELPELFVFKRGSLGANAVSVA